MKRYIRASISLDTPEWLRHDLARDFGKNLSKNFRIALDKVRFLDHDPENGNSVAIYNIPTSYGSIVYAPGVNDSKEMAINGRWRKLGSVAKSKLPQMATDIVWIDLDNPENRYNKKDRYQDPRYTYRYDPKGKYAGQQKREIYLGNDQYEERWTEQGLIPSNESRARDKSGYKVPRPEDMIARFYSKFPEKMTERVNSVYEMIRDVQNELMQSDFNSPTRYSNKFRNAYTRFGDAVDQYRTLLNGMRSGEYDSRSWDAEYGAGRFSGALKSIKSDLADVREYLAEVEQNY